MTPGYARDGGDDEREQHDEQDGVVTAGRWVISRSRRYRRGADSAVPLASSSLRITRILAMDSVLTDDDFPPSPAPRPLPRGLLWAAALATIVLAIAVVVSFSFDDSGANVTKLSLSDPESPLDADQTAQDLPGETIPPLSFARYDPTTRTFTSQAGSLQDYRGAPLVLNFWASTCGPCIAEMPAIEQVSQEFGDRVAFLGVNPKTDPTAAAVDMIDKTGATYDLGNDAGSSMAMWFGITLLPTTIFVHSDGTIAKVHIGEITAPEIEQILTDEMGL